MALVAPSNCNLLKKRENIDCVSFFPLAIPHFLVLLPLFALSHCSQCSTLLLLIVRCDYVIYFDNEVFSRSLKVLHDGKEALHAEHKFTIVKLRTG